jgi:hypothetical protein
MSGANSLQTNYQTHTPPVHAIWRGSLLFDIKLSCGKLVTQSFQHRQKNGVARKAAIEFMPHARFCSEAIDFDEEMGRAARASGTRRRSGVDLR